MYQVNEYGDKTAPCRVSFANRSSEYNEFRQWSRYISTIDLLHCDYYALPCNERHRL